ncbi:FAD-dependent oxidoreductase [Streptomyces sp. AcE210]|uniref:NAD(P)/FAD-dependent oxidoreductase n=1 Tax=Streptomyces sp. AcE210 TaxID=2292703 RepID=UPI000E309BF2|nr:FAD-dependent oxidoreductase [Streptomyces sp. AcE210]RFC71911.1 pyridine nucleotide-disulfide oxidoreductase [Streptomyces sp. AcE210]
MATDSVVVVGAGQAGLETAAALRGRGYEGRITLVGDEPSGPCDRPPLSKGYLAGTVPAADIALRPPSFYAAQDIELLSGDRVASVDRERRTVLLESGLRLPYGALVLATGCRPRTLPVPGASLTGVLTLRGLADAEDLRLRLSGPTRSVVVVGAGFIGLEVAATARGLGHDVTVVEAQPRALARALTPQMSAQVVAEHRAQGVRMLLGREVSALYGDAEGRVQVMELADGERMAADLVVVGVGVLPNTRLALTADLVVGDGIVVDERLRTEDPDIYAVGDCARFPSPHAGRYLRLESVQNATDQARCVAAAICGEPYAYTAVPWFWSEQYAMRLQMAGLTAAHDETVTVGDPDGGRFSVLCFRAGRLIGAESMNRPADHGIARRLLTTGTHLTPETAREPGFDLKKLPRTPAVSTGSPAVSVPA